MTSDSPIYDSEKQMKPPLGLKPFYIHRAERISEIAHAMNRYVEAGKRIPDEWIAEFQTLIATWYDA